MSKWQYKSLSEFLKERENRFKPDDKTISSYKRLDKIDFSGQIHISEKPSKTDMILIEPGDLVISGINVAKGALAVYEGYEPITATIHYSSYMFNKDKIDINFLKRFLKSPTFISELQKQVKGGIKTEIKAKHLLSLKVRIPELTEQQKINKHFDATENEIAELLNESQTQAILLTKLHQAILQEAIEGKLTAKWRKENPVRKSDPNYDAKALLEKIKVEKEKLIKEGKNKKQKPLPPIKPEEVPFELPDGWVWCRWIDLLSNDKYSMKRGPFGSALRKDFFVKKGVRVFEQYNPINDDPYWMRYFITEEKYNELKAFTAKPGDLLISCSGVTLGRITEIPDDTEKGIINQALLKINLDKRLISNDYFKYLFRSPYMQKNIFDMAWGAAQPNMVGVEELKKIVIPLPSIIEQNEILSKYKHLLAIVDELEKQVADRKEKAEQLMQAVLREAFEGVR